jgi:anaerobic magnesium-protoporphyrin IX monomethyl ester cyclase
MVVVGQGERKFYDLVKCLLDNNLKGLETIPGLFYKNNGHLVLKDIPPVEDMNDFPAVPYDIIEVEKCISKTEYGNRTLQYLSSYGCPFRCSFCIEPVISKRRWVGLQAERVVDEWGYLQKKYNIDAIAVYDSNFFVDKNRVVGICDELLRNNIKIKIGNVNGRIPQLVKYEKKIWQLMERAGISMILTGSESGDQEVLDLIKKDAAIEDIYKFTKLCNEHNIKVLFSYMSGIPWSKDPEYNRVRVDREISGILFQVDRLLKISKKNRFMIYAYSPLPGSELYYKAIDCGFEPPKTLQEWSGLVSSPEDIFKNTGCEKRWITQKQFFLITMLEQYIFGMMDLDAKGWIGDTIKNRLLRFIFRLGFTLGYYLAKIRLKFKIFIFPVDYWIFIRVRELLGA